MMKALILDGSLAGDRIGSFSAASLQADLAQRGSTSEVVVLRDKKIGNCMRALSSPKIRRIVKWKRNSTACWIRLNDANQMQWLLSLSTN
ncbi:MAG: hypothetical protein NT163_02420, partial [Chlorobiales bacterium]|nr:hypothetical protein [Chlorobiales bacterium]